MALIEQIQQNVAQLPQDKQVEVLDFIFFLKQRSNLSKFIKPRSLKNHAAFGSWRPRQIDAVQYQQLLRAEWGN